ncbi:MAG: MBL fold metallo-hydrolase [Chromatiales bacterium]|nr:MBL fold metallo-hydrolase [Chromatiales bacterium]
MALLIILSASLLTLKDSQALNLKTHKISNTVYALVGELGPRTYENNGLNNTMGFVITGNGVVLIDSGASPIGAAEISKRVAAVTSQPIKWVINTGSQDHRWLGNSYFRQHGAEIIALKKTVTTEKKFVDDHIRGLRNTLKERADGIVPQYATNELDTNHAKLTLGGVKFEIIWFGNSHFPGDSVVWLPAQKIVFTGDMVYLDRMLGILPYSNVLSWQKSFHKMEQLNPKWVVPGHGNVYPLATAQAETGNYLDFLVNGVRKAQADWLELDDTVNLLSEKKRVAPFVHLKNFDSWHRTNINRTYLTLESVE